MEQIEIAFRKAQGGDDQLYSLGRDKATVQFPAKFQMDGIEIFIGLGFGTRPVDTCLLVVSLRCHN